MIDKFYRNRRIKRNFFSSLFYNLTFDESRLYSESMETIPRRIFKKKKREEKRINWKCVELLFDADFSDTQ